MVQAFAVIQVLLCMALVGLILMHSGRDAGLGGMGFTPASQGGTHIVERNLTRLTVVVAILFVANCIAALPRTEVAALLTFAAPRGRAAATSRVRPR